MPEFKESFWEYYCPRCRKIIMKFDFLGEQCPTCEAWLESKEMVYRIKPAFQGLELASANS